MGDLICLDLVDRPGGHPMRKLGTEIGLHRVTHRWSRGRLGTLGSVSVTWVDPDVASVDRRRSTVTRCPGLLLFGDRPLDFLAARGLAAIDGPRAASHTEAAFGSRGGQAAVEFRHGVSYPIAMKLKPMSSFGPVPADIVTVKPVSACPLVDTVRWVPWASFPVMTGTTGNGVVKVIA